MFRLYCTKGSLTHREFSLCLDYPAERMMPCFVYSAEKKIAHSERDDSLIDLLCRKRMLIQAEKMILCLS